MPLRPLEPLSDIVDGRTAAEALVRFRQALQGKLQEKDRGPLSPAAEDRLAAGHLLKRGYPPQAVVGAFPSATFSVRELALLADMKEGAVRNAMSNGDRVAAAEWLPKKRGFRSLGANAAAALVERAASLRDLVSGLRRLVPDDVVPNSWRAEAWDGELADLLPVAEAAGVDAELLTVRMTQLWVRERRHAPSTAP